MASNEVTTRVEAPSQEMGLRASVSKQRLIFIVIGTMLGMLLGALDQTVVSTALPTITTHLGGASEFTLVVTAYLLASTVAVPIYGKLSDIYGRRIFFLGGMILFLIGSALSGTATDMTQLILYRALQGLGAGSLMPIAQAIIGDVFPPAERGKWQGLMVSVFGLATILGPLAGGWITDNWGWRWVFYINMPVGILGLITVGLALPKLTNHRAHKVDYLGSVAIILASVPLLVGFTLPTPGMVIDGVQYGFTSPLVLGLFAFSALMWVVFFLIEARAAEPIISPRLFKSSIFTSSVVATFMLAAGMFGAIYFLPLFVQDVMGQNATNSGIILMPMMLGFMASSMVGGQLLARTGRYKVLALFSFALGIVGMLLFSRMTAATPQSELIRNMVVTGLGIGSLMSLFTIVVQNAFPFRQLGEVTAGLQFFRSIGSTIGLAVLGVAEGNVFSTDFQQNLPAPIRAAMNSGQLGSQTSQSGFDLSAIRAALLAKLGPAGEAVFQQVAHAATQALASSIGDVFLLGAGVMAVGFLATLFLKEIPLRKAHSAESAHASVEASREASTEAEVVEVAPVLG